MRGREDEGAEIVMVHMPSLNGDTVILAWLHWTLSPEGTEEAVTLTESVNPLRLVTVIVAFLELPALTFSLVGVEVIENAAGLAIITLTTAT